MTEYHWAVVLHTPLGERHGHMHADIENGRVSGELLLLRHREPFQGELLPDSSCSLTGTLISLRKIHGFHAHGTMGPDKLRLQIGILPRELLLTGTPESDTDTAGAAERGDYAE